MLRVVSESVVPKEEGKAPRMVQCETCAIAKMHKILNRAQSGRATKPYQVPHFDLTLLNSPYAIAYKFKKVSEYRPDASPTDIKRLQRVSSFDRTLNEFLMY